MNLLSPCASRSFSYAMVIAMVGLLVAAPRAHSQTATPTDTPTDTPTPSGSPTTTPTASGSTTPTVTPTATPLPTETTAPAGGPTTAPAQTPTPVPTVAPTPFVGGSAGVTSVADEFGTGGETVSAGKFEVHNETEETERITRVVIQATDPEVMSSLSLNGKSSSASQTATIASPATENIFLFDQGVEIPPGETATFTLTAVIASQAETTAEATATPSSGATTTPEPTATQTPDVFAVSRRDAVPVVVAAAIPLRHGSGSDTGRGGLAAILVLLAAAAATRSDRRGLSAALFLLAMAAILWMSAVPGCGAEQPTSQTVGRIRGETDTGPVTFTGVPFSLGTVSRPQNLAFPGTAATPRATRTP